MRNYTATKVAEIEDGGQRLVNFDPLLPGDRLRSLVVWLDAAAALVNIGEVVRISIALGNDPPAGETDHLAMPLLLPRTQFLVTPILVLTPGTLSGTVHVSVPLAAVIDLHTLYLSVFFDSLCSAALQGFVAIQFDRDGW